MWHPLEPVTCAAAACVLAFALPVPRAAGEWIPDSSLLWTYSPAYEWSTYSGIGPPNDTLHFAYLAGSTATITSTKGSPPPPSDTVVFVHGACPSCGIMNVSLNGATVTVDSYAASVDWTAQAVLPLHGASWWTLTVTCTGGKNASSFGTACEVVGLIV